MVAARSLACARGIVGGVVHGHHRQADDGPPLSLALRFDIVAVYSASPLSQHHPCRNGKTVHHEPAHTRRFGAAIWRERGQHARFGGPAAAHRKRSATFDRGTQQRAILICEPAGANSAKRHARVRPCSRWRLLRELGARDAARDCRCDPGERSRRTQGRAVSLQRSAPMQCGVESTEVADDAARSGCRMVRTAASSDVHAGSEGFAVPGRHRRPAGCHLPSAQRLRCSDRSGHDGQQGFHS